jgi:hypothetical protein
VTLVLTGTGGYVASFTDYTPTARFGSNATAWTIVQVEEASAKDGAVQQTVSTALTPLDTNPAEPAARDFTLQGALLASGWYRVTFLDAAGNQQPFEWVHNAASISPGHRDVGRLIRARTYAAGAVQGTFLNSDQSPGPTDPTADEVDRLITDVADTVRAKVGTIPDDLHPAARTVIKYGTALEIEVGAEDFDQDRYDRLKTQYDEQLKTLIAGAQDEADGGQIGESDDRPGPLGFFPAGVAWDTEKF